MVRRKKMVNTKYFRLGMTVPVKLLIFLFLRLGTGVQKVEQQRTVE
jgi:hypothetical protein